MHNLPRHDQSITEEPTNSFCLFGKWKKFEWPTDRNPETTIGYNLHASKVVAAHYVSALKGQPPWQMLEQGILSVDKKRKLFLQSDQVRGAAQRERLVANALKPQGVCVCERETYIASFLEYEDFTNK